MKFDEQGLIEQIKNHSKADEEFLISSCYLLELANHAPDLFKSSQPAKKRKLISFAFANLEADGGNLIYKLKIPFNVLFDAHERKNWQAIADILRIQYYDQIIEFGRVFKTFNFNLENCSVRS